MRGMILAAGAGVRMQPLTHARAKPALPVFDVPLVVHAARLVRSAGIREIVINLHHRPRTVREALEIHQADPTHPELKDVTFSFSREATLLGTGGGIGRVASWLAAEGTAVVVNCDFLSDISLPEVLQTHARTGAAATVVGVSPFDPFPGELHVAPDGRLLAIEGVTAPPAPLPPSPAPPLEFTGVQVLEPGFIAAFPDRPCDSVREVYPGFLRRGEVFVHRHAGWWWEFGSPARFLDGHLYLLDRLAGGTSSDPTRGTTFPGTILRSGDGAIAWAGAGADISPSAKIRGRAVIGAGARVRAGAEVEDSVLLDRVQVPQGTRLKRCLVASGTIFMGGSSFQEAAIASSPCSTPSLLASAAETAGGRHAPPKGCRAETDLWVRPL